MTERAGASWLLYILVALCVAAGVVAFLVVGPPAQSASPTRIAIVGRGVVQSTVSASGALAAVDQTSINFKVAGRLAAVNVHVGEHVLTGRLLAELDPTEAQRNLVVAEDNLRAAQDRLTDAQDSSASTAAQPTQSPAATSATVASDEGAVESAKASVVSAEEALADTKLYAPVDGTVASIAQETPGNTVSASTGGTSGGSASSGSSGANSGNTGGGTSSATSNGTSGAGSGTGGSGTGGSGGDSSGSSSTSANSSSAFVVLVDTSNMQVVVPLSESEITKVKVGQPATVTVHALPAEKLAAKVVSSALLSTTNSGVVSYDVTLKLEQGESGLRPGMTASAQIVVSQAENAVNVTSSAISGRGAAQTVTVLRNGKAVRQPVVTGLVGDTVTQVLSGLTPGEQVQVPIATGTALGGGSAAGAFGGRAGGLGVAIGGGGGLGAGGGGGGGRFFGGGGAG